MLLAIDVGKRTLSSYEDLVNKTTFDEINSLGKKLAGKSVLHITPYAFGGGVEEIFYSVVPLKRELKLNVDWCYIEETQTRFLELGRKVLKAFRGEEVVFTSEEKEEYFKFCQKCVSSFRGSYDYIIVHSPILLGLIQFRNLYPESVWIWKCDLDIHQPSDGEQKILLDLLNAYDAGIFTMLYYIPKGVNLRHISISPPSIDPLSLKNSELSLEIYTNIISKYGVDIKKPIILQISSFHPSRDPLGVIDAYKLVKEEVPSAQLVFITFIQQDNPKMWFYYERALRRAGEDYDVFFLSNINGIESLESNAFQRGCNVVVKKSLQEDFGIVVTEALWKAKPVVATNVGGLSLQVIDGVNGYLVEDIPGCAEKIIYLLKNPKIAQKMGELGKEYVRENFLITRQLLDYLKLMDKFN